MKSLDDVNDALERSVRSAVARSAIVTRLILRTGINVNEPRPEQRRDPECVRRVLSELQRMGIALDATGGATL